MFAAQIAVLQGCSKELSKLLHRNRSCLLAARVFVISRLVLKSLQEKVCHSVSWKNHELISQ